jgi:hypothetical protein
MACLPVWIYECHRLTLRGRHVATGIKLLSHTAANGRQPKRVVTTTSPLTMTERTMEPHTIQTMPLPSCNRSKDSPILIFKNAIAKPLTRTAKFENLRAPVICKGSRRNLVFPYPYRTMTVVNAIDTKLAAYAESVALSEASLTGFRQPTSDPKMK